MTITYLKSFPVCVLAILIYWYLFDFYGQTLNHKNRKVYIIVIITNRILLNISKAKPYKIRYFFYKTFICAKLNNELLIENSENRLTVLNLSVVFYNVTLNQQFSII